MWRSSFLVNFQACRLIAGNFTNIRTPSQIFFNSILTSPLPISPRVFNTCGKPCHICSLGRWEILLGEDFYVVVGIWGGVILTVQTFFKAKKQHCKNSPQWGLKWTSAGRRRIFYTGWWKFEVKGQVIEYNKNIFFKKLVENEAESSTRPAFVF